MEQVHFLHRLHTKELGVGEAPLERLEAISLAEERNGRKLHTKTGTGEHQGRWGGWVSNGTTRDDFALVCLHNTFDNVESAAPQTIASGPR
jgi:beta-lactamase class D